MGLGMNRRELILLGAAAPVSIGAQTAPWKPLLFDAHQNETVIALTELIIPATDTPGAKAALVNRHLDKQLHDGPVERQQQFLEGLAGLDGQAIRRHGHPFVRCTRGQQSGLLEGLETEGNRFFGLAKRATAEIYYATEIGFKELNKDGRVPAGFACTHPEHRAG